MHFESDEWRVQHRSFSRAGDVPSLLAKDEDEDDGAWGTPWTGGAFADVFMTALSSC